MTPQILVLFGLVLSSAAAWVVIFRRKRDFFHPLVFQVLLVVVLVAIRALWIVDGRSGMLQDPTGARVLPAVAFYLAFFALGFGVYAAGRRAFPSLRRIRIDVRPSWTSRGGVAFSAIPYLSFGVLSILVLMWMVHGPASFFANPAKTRSVFAGHYVLFYGLFAITIGALVLMAARFDGDYRKLVTIALFGALLLAIAATVFTGERGTIILLSVYFLVLYNVLKKRVGLLPIAAVLFVAFLLLPIMTGIVYQGYGPRIAHGEIGLLFAPSNYNFDTFIGQAYGRYYTLEGTVRTLEKLHSGEVTPDHGRYLLAFPRILLPTALVGSKPSVTQDLCTTFYSDRYAPGSGTSCVTSLPAFMYWEIGVVGYIFAGLFYGILLLLWVSVYEGGGVGNALFVAITYLDFMMVFTGHIATFAALIYLAALLVPLFGVRLAPPVSSGPRLSLFGRRERPLQETPFVSIIIPCRNEKTYIETCLDSVFEGNYPRSRIEVLVVDGMSDDGTREILGNYSRKVPEVRVLDNPAKTTPHALNVGVRAAKGEVIMRLDAHAVYPEDYVAKMIGWLRSTNAANVGGVWATLPANGSPKARAIAHALASPLGVGNSHFRTGVKEPRLVDTVPFGCWRREVFDCVGLFDEDLLRNQDDEFNHRTRRAGGRVILVPDVRVGYVARGTLRNLSKMYYQYGAYKPLATRRGGEAPTLRQLAAPSFVSALLLAAVLALNSPPAGLVLATLIGCYFAVVFVAVASTARRDLGAAPWIAVAIPAIHLSYGIGYLRGVVPGIRNVAPGASGLSLSR